MGFKKGNRAAEKPKYCPYCKKEVEVRYFCYIYKKDSNPTFQNEEK